MKTLKLLLFLSVFTIVSACVMPYVPPKRFIVGITVICDHKPNILDRYQSFEFHSQCPDLVLIRHNRLMKYVFSMPACTSDETFYGCIDLFKKEKCVQYAEEDHIVSLIL